MSARTKRDPLAQPRPPSRREFAGTPRFELRRRLGAGGFGVVFEAFDRERRARVALKVLERDDAATIYRFKQEFRALADIVHPNLVQLYELHVHDERWFFTMELVEGADAIAVVRGGARHEDELAATQAVASSEPEDSVERSVTGAGVGTTLQVASTDSGDGLSQDAAAENATPRAPDGARSRAGFDEGRLRSILRQLAEGLSALHDAGKVHRDIKPSNVLVAHDGRVVLVDFGLAMSFAESSYATASMLAGTPAYMAPEQVRGDAPAPAWDWYGVGVLLFEALTGQLPFDGTLIEVLSRKQSHDPPAPSALTEGVPPDLDRLCVDLLARTPEARPGGRAILERVGAAATRAPAKLKSAFVGRAAERRALADALGAAARVGAAAVALVAGPSGVGKSALVRRVREDLAEITPDLVFLGGRCYEQESVPYKAIDGLIDPLSRYLKQLPGPEVGALLPADVGALARLFPVLEQVEQVRDAPRMVQGGDAREARRRAFRALRELFARLARARSLVLYIDDLQWGDADSGALLVDLLAPPDPPRVLLIAAYRNDDTASPCLRTFLPALSDMHGPALQVVELALENLPEGDALELARALLAEVGKASEDLAAAVARESGGRPFFVDELVRYSRDRASASLRADAEDLAAHGVSLDAIVRERVAELPDPARRLLQVIAVAGRPLERGAAARAADIGSEEPGAYNLLRTERLVRLRDVEGRDELETYHDRIREAVAAGISAEARAAYFRRLAETLDGDGSCDAETLSVYWLEAGEIGRAANLAATAAADAARTLAFDRAVRLYYLALELRGQHDPAALRALREGLGGALENAGRGADAAEALLAAAAGADAARALELRRRAAEQLLISGHIDLGLDELRLVLAEVRLLLPETPTQAILWLLFSGVLLLLRGLRFRRRREEEIPPDVLLRLDTCSSVSKSLSFVDTVRGAYFGVRSVAMALAAGEPRRILRALALLVGYGGGAGGARPLWIVRKVATVAQKLADEIDDPLGRGLLRMCVGVTRVLGGRWKKGRDDLSRALVTFRERCTGATWEIDTAEQFALLSLSWQGAWKEIASRIPRLLADARERGDLYAETTYTLCVGHLPALLADDPTAAEHLLGESLSAWSRQRFNVQHYYFTLALAEVHLYAERGRGVLAARHLDGAWRDLEGSRLMLFQLPGVEMHWARFRALAALLAGDGAEPAERRRALSLARRIARRLGRVRVPWVTGLAHMARATLASLRGRRDEAIAALVAAEAAFETTEMPHYAAAARRRRGELLGGDEGRTHVRVADVWMGREGARDPARAAAMLAPGRW